ncbi:hypothetical protein Dimus_032460 [Dionaea muscipula]
MEGSMAIVTGDTSRKRAGENADLFIHEEVLVEILARLPDYNFENLLVDFQLSADGDNGMCLHFSAMDVDTLSLVHRKFQIVSSSTNRNHYRTCTFGGSCNGIVCLLVEDEYFSQQSLLLWNPATGGEEVLFKIKQHKHKPQLASYNSITQQLKLLRHQGWFCLATCRSLVSINGRYGGELLLDDPNMSIHDVEEDIDDSRQKQNYYSLVDDSRQKQNYYSLVDDNLKGTKTTHGDGVAAEDVSLSSEELSTIFSQSNFPDDANNTNNLAVVDVDLDIDDIDLDEPKDKPKGGRKPNVIGVLKNQSFKGKSKQTKVENERISPPVEPQKIDKEGPVDQIKKKYGYGSPSVRLHSNLSIFVVLDFFSSVGGG